VAGVDEAGRGPWAGPVVAAAVVLRTQRLPVRIDDSKRLTRAQRQRAYWVILERADVGIGIVCADDIDRYNILRASLLAMERAVQDLAQPPDALLVDGPICPSVPLAGGGPALRPASGGTPGRAPAPPSGGRCSCSSQRRPSTEGGAPPRRGRPPSGSLPLAISPVIRGSHLAATGGQPLAPAGLSPPSSGGATLPCWPLIAGDRRSRLIGCASIMAKVLRDELMSFYHDLAPQYAFAQHQGYGTSLHAARLRAHGPSFFHRASFRPVRETLRLHDQEPHDRRVVSVDYIQRWKDVYTEK
jgi:ribonuclease HII